jgi:hypothetical protein
MTPKETAIELYDKFHVWDTMNHKEVKALVLIAVDEILEEIIDCSDEELLTSKTIFWLKVKKEIERL